jgi:hypothetical protein
MSGNDTGITVLFITLVIDINSTFSCLYMQIM